jgi:hypothetical protein
MNETWTNAQRKLRTSETNAQRKPRTSKHTRHHDSRQAHRCQNACFILTNVSCFWKILHRLLESSTVNPVGLSEDRIFLVHSMLFFWFTVCMNGSVESVSPRGDSDKYV